MTATCAAPPSRGWRRSAIRNAGAAAAALRQSLRGGVPADVLATLGSRAEFAHALIDAVEAGKVPSKDLSPFLVRQMLSLNDAKLRDKIGKVWGTVRPANLTQLPRYLSVVPPDAPKKADRSQGRALFVKHCASCHALFNEGGRIGPD